MATSSQYYRGASTQASHYQTLPSADEHLYAGLATSWHSAQHQAPGFPALLQRSTSSGQRQFPRQYIQYGGPSDYVNSHVPPAASWGGSYLRPGTQEWTEAASDGTFTSRTIPYGEGHVRPAVPPRENPSGARQHQHASDASHEVLLNDTRYTYQNVERQHGHQLVGALSPPAIGPPYPRDAQRSAHVAHLLNQPSSDLQADPQHVSSQVPAGWQAGTGSGAAPAVARTPHHPSHTGDALSSAMILSRQENMSTQAWGAPSVYGRVPSVDQGWQAVEAERVNSAYTHEPVQPDQLVPAAAQHQTGRKNTSKRNVARVPASFVERQKKVKISRRKGPLDEAIRQKTHRIRKKKNGCLRCRFFKVGCDDGETCARCLAVSNSARSFKQPCTRERLEDASLVRHCNGRANQEEGEFLGYDWVSDAQFYEMDMLWHLPGYGPISTHPFRAQVRQYNPRRFSLDTAASTWRNVNGEVKTVWQPAFAIFDAANLTAGVEQYYRSCQDQIEEWIFGRIRQDALAWLTYHEVIRMREKFYYEPKDPKGPPKGNLLELVLRLQGISAVSQGYGTVCSDLPGIMEYDYSKMGRSLYEAYDRKSRDRPLPGQMSQQMDVAALKYLKKLEKQCAKELGIRIFQSHVKPWYELLLALFVIFWNLEYIRGGAQKYIMSKNGTDIENHLNVVNKQLEKWESAFRVLMHHWQAVMRDYKPFKLARENPQELRENGHVDQQGFQYVMAVARILEQGRPEQHLNPYVGAPGAQCSLTSEWIRALFKEAGA